jgi:hypothetical protein
VLPTTGDPDEAGITLPLRSDLGDFVLRMGDVLHTVAAVKQLQSFAELRTFCRIRAKTLDDRLAAMIAAARCSVTRSSLAVFIHSQRAPTQAALRRETVPE